MPSPRIAALAAFTAFTAVAAAQEVPEQSTTHHLGIDSGLVQNQNPSPAAAGIPEVIWSTVVTVPGSAWLRLHYGGVLLAGSGDRGGNGSLLRLTSLTDGAFQTQHRVHVGQWRDTSAYFNGDAVLVELLACPQTGDNRLILQEVVAGPALPADPDTICGPTDDRVLAFDDRVARNQPGGCTSWLIDDCNHCFLTAGHCAGSLQVVEFHVPLSSSSGAIQHPPPQDQYSVDPASLQTNGGLGVGNDWAYFGVFDNSTTGLTPYQANGGLTFQLQSTPPPVTGQQIRITGNGSTSSPVSPTWYLVQKTHAGPYFSFTGTTVRYVTDTTGGNSGSPVILDGTDQAIGIHTHGGCTSTGGSNAGTASNHAGLQAALAAPLGVCACPGVVFAFPNGLPDFVAPDGSTTIRVQLGGAAGFVAGSVRMHVSTGGSFQAVVPAAVNATTFDAAVPAAPCGAVVSYWFSAQGNDLATYTSPAAAPASLHTTVAAEGLTVLRAYDFDTSPPGWAVVNTSLAAGPWQRGTPIDSRGPQTDFDGSGQCWVTGNTNLVDVDGGPTTLITETFYLAGSNDPVVRCAVWFANDLNDDRLLVDVSNDSGAHWTNVADLGPFAGWLPLRVRVRDVFASPAQFVMRFRTSDQPDDSVTEAAMDAFRLEDVVCTQPTWSTYGGGCASGASAPAQQLVSLPALGGSFALQVDNVVTATPVLLLGFAAENVPVPLPQFAPGCTLLARPDVFAVLTASGGSAPWSLAIPAAPTLAGTRIHTQAIDFGIAWTMSAGGVGEIH